MKIKHLTETDVDKNAMDRRQRLVDKIHNWEDGRIRSGGLNLQGYPLERLPNNLTVNGDLDICGTLIKELPEKLHVAHNLFLTGLNISKLTKGLVAASIRADDTSIIEIDPSVECDTLTIINTIFSKYPLLLLKHKTQDIGKITVVPPQTPVNSWFVIHRLTQQKKEFATRVHAEKYAASVLNGGFWTVTPGPASLTTISQVDKIIEKHRKRLNADKLRPSQARAEAAMELYDNDLDDYAMLP